MQHPITPFAPDLSCPREVDDNDIDLDARHPQVLAQWGTRRAYVDWEMAPLLRELWEAGVDTIASCQDLGESLENLPVRSPHMAAFVEAATGQAVIDFYPPDAQVFLTLVANGAPPSAMYDRMTRWTAKGGWHVALDLMDVPRAAHQHDFRVFGSQVRFPRADVPLIIECLRRHNERVAAEVDYD
jgi:hypothetical protein